MFFKCFRNDFFEYDVENDAIFDIQYCVESDKKKYQFVYWKKFFLYWKNRIFLIFSMIWTFFFKYWYWILFASLRRINDLIDWNWNSNVEFKLIAKNSFLNELNSIEFAIWIWLICLQNAKKMFWFVYISIFFLNFFFVFSSKYDFFFYNQNFDICRTTFVLKKTLKWYFW